MKTQISLNVKWNKSVKTITWVCSALMLIALIGISWALSVAFSWIGVALLFIIPIVCIYAITLSPTRILIDDDYVTIKRMIGSKKIERSALADAYPHSKGDFNARLFGSGGFFGYTGLFANKKEGRYTSYVGDHNEAYYLVLKNGKKYLLSSENREQAVEALKAGLRG